VRLRRRAYRPRFGPRVRPSIAGTGARRAESERAAAADDKEPHPAKVKAGSRSGAVIRTGGRMLDPMELTKAEQRREAIAAARMNALRGSSSSSALVADLR
jgi:hypothetical protein